MSDDTRGPDPASGASMSPGPPRIRGLIRSLAHRLAGERPALPVEGRLAPFEGATGWLNTAPLTPAGLRGRVVLVDFWTYTCVNWLRTLPYVRAWATKYAATEMALQQLLLDDGADGVDQDLVMVEPRGLEVAADWRTLRSPETYAGYGQGTGFAQEEFARLDAPAVYAAPARLPLNTWGLAGTWTVARHAAVLNETGGRVAFQFHARDVNLVMGPASRGASVPFRVSLDGQPAAGAYGVDVAPDGSGVVGDQRTYQLIRQPGPIADRRFEIEFGDGGVEVYCFTFG